MKQELSAFELKEQGNKYFAHQKYQTVKKTDDV